MNVKEYLSQSFTLYKLIKAKEKRIKQMREMLESTGKGLQTSGKVQTSLKTEYICEATANLLDAEDEYRKDIAQLGLLQKEIENIVESVPKLNHRLILYERYILLNNWEGIAVNNNYSLKWVYVLHNRGLKDVEKIIYEKQSNLKDKMHDGKKCLSPLNHA